MNKQWMKRGGRVFTLLCGCTLVWAACMWDAAAATEKTFTTARQAMVKGQIEARGVHEERVLEAMRRVPRHKFVAKMRRRRAYDDTPVAIGQGQTISQPYIVAFMTQTLDIKPGQTVLEIGTGSGYQAAILAEMVGKTGKVYTIEILPELGRKAKKRLKKLGYDNVFVRIGDGYRGWPEHAPFDAVIVTAAPPDVPQPLVEQLKAGGRMVLPVGAKQQKLQLINKTPTTVATSFLLDVSFVPMVGEVQKIGGAKGAPDPK